MSEKTNDFVINAVRVQDVLSLSQMPFATSDLIRFCFGDKIGQGIYRSVYEWSHKKGVVIKYADAVEQNITEWAVWNAVKGTKHSKWFAPVVDCSPCGHFLLMKRARPIRYTDKIPKTAPAFLTDKKKSNYGFIGKQLVCIDYHFISRAFDCAATAKTEFSLS